MMKKLHNVRDSWQPLQFFFHEKVCLAFQFDGSIKSKARSARLPGTTVSPKQLDVPNSATGVLSSVTVQMIMGKKISFTH